MHYKLYIVQFHKAFLLKEKNNTAWILPMGARSRPSKTRLKTFPSIMYNPNWNGPEDFYCVAQWLKMELFKQINIYNTYLNNNFTISQKSLQDLSISPETEVLYPWSYHNNRYLEEFVDRLKKLSLSLCPINLLAHYFNAY